jgi:hypothetical protein
MNLMGKFKLDRRTVLRGAGSIAIALPWLEIMGHDKEAHAAGTPAKRFLSVYQPGGTVLEKHWPTANDPSASVILAPLAANKAKLLVLKGLNMTCAVGEQHQSGIIGFLTGSKQTGSPKDYSSYASIDQVIATRLQSDAASKRPHGSLQFAVRWATGKSHGLLSPINSANFEDSPKLTPLPPRLDPQQIFNDLFGSLNPGGGGTMTDTRVARRKSVLDYVDKRYVALSQRLGAADKAKLENHLTKLRDIEGALSTGVVATDTCKSPTKVDTKGYNPTTGLNSGNAGEIIDENSDAMIPTVGKFMMDMMVMAFACNLTNVGHFQWTDTEAKHTFPWLSLKNHHHYYQHDGPMGFYPDECGKIGTWYSEMHSYLLTAMDKVEVAPGVTLLDESVVFFGSELAHPPTHEKKSVPFMLAGGGGGLKGGRMLDFGGKAHNNLLVSILNLFGDARTSYGHPEYNSGALTGLTG